MTQPKIKGNSMQPFQKALAALRAAALIPDLESILFAQSLVAGLPDSPHQTAALTWLERAMTTALDCDSESILHYVRAAVYQFEAAAPLAVQYRASYQQYKAARNAWDTDPTDDAWNAYCAAMMEVDGLRRALALQSHQETSK